MPWDLKPQSDLALLFIDWANFCWLLNFSSKLLGIYEDIGELNGYLAKVFSVLFEDSEHPQNDADQSSFPEPQLYLVLKIFASLYFSRESDSQIRVQSRVLFL